MRVSYSLFLKSSGGITIDQNVDVEKHNAETKKDESKVASTFIKYATS